MSDITVTKRDEHGQNVLTYPGKVAQRDSNRWVYLQAIFQPQQAEAGPIVFYQGDMFHEWFYADRWYNVFRVEAGTSRVLRGWYCNITRPAVITAHQVKSDDLALDVLILPNGALHLLDVAAFNHLALSNHERAAAWGAVREITERYTRQHPPFDLSV